MLRNQLSEAAHLQPPVEPKDGNTEEDGLGVAEPRAASRSPSKGRSLSLSDRGPPTLSPSPKFREPEKRKSKDDSAITESPTTPRRPVFPPRGLSLQMPARDLMSPNTSAYISRVPLSPKLDHSQTYGSPTSVLPRRSRGLDFSRAATNLHHSTLAEQSSPDSSPTIGGRAMNIPNRKNGVHYTSGSDAMTNNPSSLWSTMANADRVGISSSLGSVKMMGSDSSSNSSDDDDLDLMDADDIDDSILTTPQIGKMSTPFGAIPQPSPGSGWMGQSPAVSSLMNFQRARYRHGKSKSSSSGCGSGMRSRSSKSPPTMRNMEHMNLNRDMASDGPRSRRESISWAANQLNISGSESDDGTLKSTLENADGLPVTPGRDGQRGVIRRAVTRRGNMLPKTKGFARIRAALAEEGAPVETEVRREAEVVRQTREADVELEPTRHPSLSTTTTSQSSPNLGPTTQELLEGIPEDDMMADISSGFSSSFQQHAMRNSKGKEFWDTFADEKNRTPPPPQFLPRGSIAVSDDAMIDSPTPSIPRTTSTSENHTSSPSRSSTPQSGTLPTTAEITQKVNKKRRRDDDFDPTSFKRRAVSPGMSVHNSPVIQSPMQRDVTPWGARPPSNGETGKVGGNGGPHKRVGFQGMVDTNDSLMKMNIE
ncbi:Uncharacterized protein BP5553_04590 [Venustampulla echinocandica]|uniref:Uncharacterized protein n=1 Tax=Venustampulla echinocandica TaxID=2656787 RepID=A0A370TNR0_9HELO|nr:Uncharacterized protein BP5553_04590 [Venustampulla echinocandica]RDL37157.1 Uncharacterized protein BP5553_04590 [Venustampulla echinocandica]